MTNSANLITMLQEITQEKIRNANTIILTFLRRLIFLMKG